MFLRTTTAAALLVAFSFHQALAKDVPNVLGLKIADAIKTINDAGYTATQSNDGKISTYPIDTVAVQDPPGGTQLQPRSNVVLFASIGVWVRDFSTLTFDLAKAELQKAGLKFEKKDDD